MHLKATRAKSAMLPEAELCGYRASRGNHKILPTHQSDTTHVPSVRLAELFPQPIHVGFSSQPSFRCKATYGPVQYETGMKMVSPVRGLGRPSGVVWGRPVLRVQSHHQIPVLMLHHDCEACVLMEFTCGRYSNAWHDIGHFGEVMTPDWQTVL
ncbi:hypothetical protein T440DRAFT_90929 [Plenodomus tracheiphilus IPT5]|uniref:Uncharacterized protein n=1 Tax=Plenodomus tracheiphilus IPT5 TaxID=1408161 RepID=A0A6A7B6Z9_9PLEO|nr:hypothetical protein T440DRAFT_90929 [Plenodomus tracheiphilus IPT5]